MPEPVIVAEHTHTRKQRWMLASTGLNTLLGISKFIWAAWTGNIIILADAVHSLADVLGALLIYAAVKLAPHHSSRFPQGLYKLEDLAAVLGGIGVAAAGYEILRTALTASNTNIHQAGATLLFILALLAIQALFVLFERRAARQLNSPGIDSDVANWLGDIGAGLVVLLGVGAQALRLPYAEPIAVFIIAALIFHSAYEVIKNSLMSLLDASVSDLEQKQVLNLIHHFPGVRGVRNFMLRKAGSAFFLTATIDVDERSLNGAHQLMDQLESQVHKTLNGIENITLHYEPTRIGRHRHVVLFGKDRQTLTQHFGAASWLRLDEKDDQGHLIARQWFKNPFAQDSDRGIRLAVWLIKEEIETAEFSPIENLDPSLSQLLEAAGIKLVSHSAPSNSPLQINDTS